MGACIGIDLSLSKAWRTGAGFSSVLKTGDLGPEPFIRLEIASSHDSLLEQTEFELSVPSRERAALSRLQNRLESRRGPRFDAEPTFASS